jgi:hypothetical protein
MAQRPRRKLGTRLLLVALAVSAIGAGGKSGEPSKPVDSATAHAVFERLKRLDGTWRGKSTKGWEDRSVIHTIAKGSAVAVRSEEEDADSAMLSVYYMDGDRLLLTHYCEARNQPRLVATAISEDGRKLLFTFLDATNLASRDNGHMDKLLLELIDDDHFSENWTWYSNGREQWLEVIDTQRVLASGKNP